MQALTLEQLDDASRAFDAAVADTEAIDHFCSSTDWILPANSALMSPRTPWVFRSDDTWVALMNDGGHAQPLEAAWGLSCPLVGSDPRRLSASFVELCRTRLSEWQVILLTGVTPKSPLLDLLVRGLAPHYDLGIGSVTRRHVADLVSGIDAFMGRRSRNFRKGLRRAERRAADDEITFETCHDVADAAAHYRRILDVEARSWKGRAEVGIAAGTMREFYQLIIGRLARRGALKTIFARHEGRDVAYIFGGVLGTTYRGLQFSFDVDYARYSLGSLCQMQQIRELCAAGYHTYDLGTDIAYKQRWADRVMQTLLLVVRQ